MSRDVSDARPRAPDHGGMVEFKFARKRKQATARRAATLEKR